MELVINDGKRHTCRLPDGHHQLALSLDVGDVEVTHVGTGDFQILAPEQESNTTNMRAYARKFNAYRLQGHFLGNLDLDTCRHSPLLTVAPVTLAPYFCMQPGNIEQ